MAIPYYGDFAEDDTVNIPFNTFDSNDPAASVTVTDLADADIKVHKDGAATPITTDGATVVIDLNSITGTHMITINTGADAAYATGSEYAVKVEGVTVDAGTLNAWVGCFSIERAGGVLALLKGTNSLANIEDKIDIIDTNVDQLETAIITNAAGADVSADIAAVKAETAAIVNDTDLIDDGTSGLAKIATDVAAILVDTGTTLDGKIDTIDSNVDAILVDTGTTLDTKINTIDTVVDGIAAALDSSIVQKNADHADIPMLMVLTSDHVTPATGLSPTLTRSLDGAAFGAKNASTTVTELSNGIYVIDANAADLNGDVVVFRLESSATADDSFLTIKTTVT